MWMSIRLRRSQTVGKYLRVEVKSYRWRLKNNLTPDEWAPRFLKCHKEDLVQRRCQNIEKRKEQVIKTEFTQYFNNLGLVLTN